MDQRYLLHDFAAAVYPLKRIDLVDLLNQPGLFASRASKLALRSPATSRQSSSR